ncbi:Imm30 family immunity protein [Butyrivibrio hungatei]|uniref:Immunity protein 30 domain-containing protein n=1 Tax=Butyrivibrio hungatei TaxID=185008 RepID=A0A1D9P424_9FIRM|nr:Imm30 family immunity protein [Butyrivibrio hungatei]AOZ96925.1 hypothetical protein bhn_I1892 [Butyrivibrio hungatei]
MDKRSLINNLKKARKLSTDEEYYMFEGALQALSNNISVDDIHDICECFCDDTQDDETMFSLIHMIEKLRGKEYLEQIAKCTPLMLESHDWAMTLNKRIINSDVYFQMYMDVIRELDINSKNKIVALMKDIKNDNPQKFSDKVDYLITSVGL